MAVYSLPPRQYLLIHPTGTASDIPNHDTAHPQKIIKYEVSLLPLSQAVTHFLNSH